MVGSHLQPVIVHLDIGRLPEHHCHELDVACQFLDLVEVGDDRDWDELISVHL